MKYLHDLDVSWCFMPFTKWSPVESFTFLVCQWSESACEAFAAIWINWSKQSLCFQTERSLFGRSKEAFRLGQLPDLRHLLCLHATLSGGGLRFVCDLITKQGPSSLLRSPSLFSCELNPCANQKRLIFSTLGRAFRQRSCILCGPCRFFIASTLWALPSSPSRPGNSHPCGGWVVAFCGLLVWGFWDDQKGWVATYAVWLGMKTWDHPLTICSFAQNHGLVSFFAIIFGTQIIVKSDGSDQGWLWLLSLKTFSTTNSWRTASLPPPCQAAGDPNKPFC